MVLLFWQYLFASFLSREEAFKLINDGWSKNSDRVKSITNQQVIFLFMVYWLWYGAKSWKGLMYFEILLSDYIMNFSVLLMNVLVIVTLMFLTLSVRMEKK